MKTVSTRSIGLTLAFLASLPFATSCSSNSSPNLPLQNQVSPSNGPTPFTVTPSSPVTSPSPVNLTAPAPTLELQSPQLAAIEKNPCPYGLDKSHEVKELSEVGVKIQFDCDSLNTEPYFQDWEFAKFAYTKSVERLSQGRELFKSGLVKRPKSILLSIRGVVASRIVSSSNHLLWRMRLDQTDVHQSFQQTLNYLVLLDQVLGTYEAKNFPRLTLETSAEDLKQMSKQYVEGLLRSLSPSLELNKSELKLLSERGLCGIGFDSDYELSLFPHRLTLSRSDQLNSQRLFIKDFALRAFYSQTYQISVIIPSDRFYSTASSNINAVAARFFVANVGDVLKTVSGFKLPEIDIIQFHLTSGSLSLPKLNYVDHFGSKLNIAMFDYDQTSPAPLSDILKEIKSLGRKASLKIN